MVLPPAEAEEESVGGGDVGWVDVGSEDRLGGANSVSWGWGGGDEEAGWERDFSRRLDDIGSLSREEGGKDMAIRTV